MASGLAGFAQGLASSPLGNLPQLMMMREELQFQREQRADSKAFTQQFESLIGAGDLAGAKALALGKGKFEVAEYLDAREQEEENIGLANIYATEGIEGLSAAALKLGRPEAITAYQNLEVGSRKNELEMEQAEANVAATRAGTAARIGTERRAESALAADLAASRVATETGRFNLDQAKGAQFANEIRGALGALGPNATPDDVETVLTHFAQGNSEEMRKAFRLPKHRQPVGFEVVPGPDGELYVVPTIYNTRTKTVGPMTDKGTSDATDMVRPMRLSSFLGMLGGGPSESGGPFKGTSMDAQYQNILLTGDPSSPEYEAAYQAFGQPKVRLDPATGNAIVQRPDMSHFRRPTRGGTAPSATAAAPGTAGRAGISLESVPGAEGKFTEGQMRAADAGARVRSALEVLQDTGGEEGGPLFETLAGFKEDALSKVPYGNYMLSSEYQRAKQSMADISSALLRLETGAAATEFERNELEKRYSPKPGDTPEVIEQKWAALNERWRNAERLAGPAYERQFGRTAPETPPPLRADTAPAEAAPAAEGPAVGTAGALAAPSPAAPAPVELPADLTTLAPADFDALMQPESLNQLTVDQLRVLETEWERRNAARSEPGIAERALDFVVPAAGAATAGDATPAPGFTLAPAEAAPAGAGAAPSVPLWSATPGPARTAGAADTGEPGEMRLTMPPGTGGAEALEALAGGSPTARIPPGAVAGGTPTVRLPSGAMAGGTPTARISPDAMAGAGPTADAAQARAALSGTEQQMPSLRIQDAQDVQREGMNVRVLVAQARNIPDNIRSLVDLLIDDGRYAEALQVMQGHVALDRDRNSYDAAMRLQMLAEVTAG